MVEEKDHPDFLRVKVYAIKEGENLNKSNFLLDGMEACMNTFRQQPLLCAFPKPMFGEAQIGDAHNSEVKYDEDEGIFYYSYLDSSSERCVGFVPHDSQILIEEVNGERWIVLEAIIWSAYNYELVKDIKKKKRINGKSRISVEIEVDESYEENGIDYLKSWRGMGITILNDKVQEAIVGANLVAYEQSEKYEKYKLAMSFAYEGKNTEDEAIYNKRKLDKGDKTLIKEKYSKEGFSCFGYDEVNAYLLKEGKLFSHPLFANEEEMEFAESEVKEMETMAKVGTEDDDKTVKMSVEEFEALNLKLAEIEKEKEEMEAKIGEMGCHAETLAKEKEEMAEKIAEMNAKFEAEEKEKFQKEFESELEDEDELEEDEKKEMTEKFEKGEYASIVDVKKEIAFALYNKRQATKESKKESFSVKIPAKTNNSSDEDKSIFAKLQELTQKL